VATLLKIIVVEDHDALREMTVEALCDQGHHAIGVDSAEALPDWLGTPPDVMVIDLNLPGEGGISLARRVRAVQPGIGIVMLTARALTAERTLGYESGADIYLTKPTSVEELGAALQAVARRLKPEQSIGAARDAAFMLNWPRLLLTGPAAQVSLNPAEAAVLSALSSALHQRMENWQLHKLLSKSEASYSKARLELVIFRLRKKMVQAGADVHAIKVIRQVGYQLSVCVRVDRF
jgi:DNA-binding response OmpR family regulator